MTNVSSVRAEELVIVKVSFDSHHFPSETDPQAVGYSPPSCLNLCTALPGLAGCLQVCSADDVCGLRMKFASQGLYRSLPASASLFTSNFVSKISRYWACNNTVTLKLGLGVT